MSARTPGPLGGRRLVVFDVDGTLYDQARLRRAMAARLLSHLAVTGRVSTLRTLRTYRRVREEMAEAERPDFEREAIARAAEAGGMDVARAAALVADWMHRRPLPLLPRCRYAGVAGLFDALRRGGIAIGILSDHPAAAKMRAMALDADLIAAAGDPDVPAQKPHPAGLRHLMARAGAAPDETILIGDRHDRDGAAARRAGIDVLIRTDRPAGPGTFRSFAGLTGPEARPVARAR